MALSRKMLKGMNISDEQIDLIIESHSETVEGLKRDLDKYKKEAEKVDSLEAKVKDFESKANDGYKEKYEKVASDLEALQAKIENEERFSQNKNAYKDLLKNLNIKEKYIDTILKAEKSSIENFSLKDGKFENEEEIKNNALNNWADFVEIISNKKTSNENFPSNVPCNNVLSRNDIMKIKDAGERQKEWEKFLQNQQE